MKIKHVVLGFLQRVLLVLIVPDSKSIKHIEYSPEDFEYRFDKHHLTSTNPVQVLKPDDISVNAENISV